MVQNLTYHLTMDQNAVTNDVSKASIATAHRPIVTELEMCKSGHECIRVKCSILDTLALGG